MGSSTFARAAQGAVIAPRIGLARPLKTVWFLIADEVNEVGATTMTIAGAPPTAAADAVLVRVPTRPDVRTNFVWK